MDLFSAVVDVDDLASAVSLLKETRTGFLKLFDSSPICMSMTTTSLGNRTYVRVNRGFVEKFQYSEREIIGRTSAEIGILEPEESDRVGTLINTKGGLHNDYVKCIKKNGDVVHTVSSIEFMEFKGEHLLVSFFIDITKIMNQQVVIEQQVEQLEAVNRELQAFSYTVSHDLRAPLSAIEGLAMVLQMDYNKISNDEARALLGTIQDNAKRMKNLIENLLEFARLGKHSIREEPIDMNHLVAEAVLDLDIIKPPKTRIIIGTLHATYGDYNLLKQVMINLISNGIKYSAKKDAPVVELTSKQDDAFIIYKVQDNGVGFDMKHSHNLFGVFQRLHKNSEFEGTGVGLATVARIVAKHGGTIHAESELGKSATFYFKMPLKPSNG